MTVLELSNVKAREYFLDPQCYGSTELPPYFDFKTVLDAAVAALRSSHLTSQMFKAAKNVDGVNYTLVNNKDGKYAWRPLQFMHPILYAYLVKTMTTAANWERLRERFAEFGKIERVKCTSIPVVKDRKKKVKGEQIFNWWSGFEQESIAQSLRYRLMLTTDITDCYGSIYTHSIAWALHGRDVAKTNRSRLLLGNEIDEQIRTMRSGQTNGIPQGSILMDFISELVLGYADQLLDVKLHDMGIQEGYFILRYRDDYRIFVNDSGRGEKILKELTVVLSSLGMRLNPAKTKVSSDIVADSVKGDKIAWLGRQCNFCGLTFEKKLLFLYSHALHFPNAGSLLQPLKDVHDNFDKMWIGGTEQVLASVAILIELAYRNPCCYQMCMAILSKLMNRLSVVDCRAVAEEVLEKVERLPHTGYLQVWLQRILKPTGINLDYSERLCQVVDGADVSLWNSEWLRGDAALYSTMQSVGIIDREQLSKINPIMDEEEIAIFMENRQGGSPC